MTDGLSDVPMGLIAPPPRKLTGEETFVGVDETFVGVEATTVKDFWRWAFTDLRDNLIRGILAEYLVVKAVGDELGYRNGWGNYDVKPKGGPTIEVKCSGFLQSWSTKCHSVIRFGSLQGRRFYPETNTYGDAPEIRAEVFVFAVQTELEPDSYDVLNIDDWDFYVVKADRVRDHAGQSVGIRWVEKYSTGKLPYRDLGKAILLAGQKNPAVAP